MTKIFSNQHIGEERKRLAEFIGMVAVALMLVGLSRLETRLFDLSKNLSTNHEFFTSVVYFGLINLNVVLILVLGWLIFRNITKLVIDRRRGVIGSRLKMKLVVSLVFFAVAPTALMFYISSRFITESFDTWFSSKVRDIMQQTREAGARVYRQDQRRLESLARIALQKVNIVPLADEYPGALPDIDASQLQGFINEYRLNAVKVFDVNNNLVWLNGIAEPVARASEDSNEQAAVDQDVRQGSTFVADAIERFSVDPVPVSTGTVENDHDKDVVKGIAPIHDHRNGRLIGVVLTEEHFETQILRSIETILTDFANLRPGAQLMRLSYMTLLIVMVAIIMFSATWLGFYVAKGITGPIQSLAEATREVALGNYSVSLQSRSDDETGQLVKAFNRMTKDLRKHKASAEASQNILQLTNDELERRRKYMEVILKNVNAGVISVDAYQTVTSVNNAAQRLLGREEAEMLGKDIRLALGAEMHKQLWCPMQESLTERQHFTAQLDVMAGERRLVFLVDGTRIYDEQGMELGVVLVFDDATEQVKSQKVAAWREVARRIAHEIKNPITPIMLNAQRLSRRYGNQFKGEDAEIFRVCLDTIINQVNSLKNMVNEFSKFSQLPAIKTKLDDINEVLREIAVMYAVSYPEISFDTSGLKEGLPLVMFDADQMNRVFVNIVTNAVAALEDQAEKKILLATSVDQRLNVLRVEIADTGKGIAAEFLDRVTEPYFSTKKDGTGLGLAIVNQVIAEHGGYLRLLPRRPNGTLVVIELPLGQQHTSA